MNTKHQTIIGTLDNAPMSTIEHLIQIVKGLIIKISLIMRPRTENVSGFASCNADTVANAMLLVCIIRPKHQQLPVRSALDITAICDFVIGSVTVIGIEKRIYVSVQQIREILLQPCRAEKAAMRGTDPFV